MPQVDAARLVREAELELTRGDTAAALERATAAFELDPMQGSTVAMLDRIFDAIGRGDPEELVTSTMDARTALREMVHARLLISLGRHLQATKTMLVTLERCPELPVVGWLAPELDNEKCHSLGLPTLRPLVVSLAQFAAQFGVPTTGGTPALATDLPALRGGAAVVAAIRNAFPGEPQLWFAEGLIRRRLAEPEVTVALAREAVQRFPADWGCLVTLANALGDAGRPEEALPCAERAVALDPSDGSPLFDVGSAFLHAQRNAEAARVFSDLLARFNDYPGAAAALQRARA